MLGGPHYSVRVVNRKGFLAASFWVKDMVQCPSNVGKEQKDRAVRMALDRLDDCPSMYAACNAIAPKWGIGSETLRRWGLQAQTDSGLRSGPTSDELMEIKKLKNRVRDRRSCQRDFGTGFDYRCEGARPSPPLICEFIDAMKAQGFAGRVRSEWSRVSRAAPSPHEPTEHGKKHCLQHERSLARM